MSVQTHWCARDSA